MAMLEQNPVRILVVNGKGGCGKTTIATNLATAYANLGHKVSLFDYDGQASSTDWWQHRPEQLAKIHLVEAHKRSTMYKTRAFQTRLPADTDTVVVDTPSAVAERDLEELLRGVNVIIVPLLPSPIDIRAGINFLGVLLGHRCYRKNPVPVGVVANRVRTDTLKISKLDEFVGRLGLPTIAAFRDSALYTQLVDNGCGLFDLEEHVSAKRELSEWERLLDWIDDALAGRDTTRSEPLAARMMSSEGKAATA
jgi:chromosome partitioning protein